MTPPYQCRGDLEGEERGTNHLIAERNSLEVVFHDRYQPVRCTSVENYITLQDIYTKSPAVTSDS